MYSLELDGLIDGSDAIARVRVDAVQSRWTDDGARIVTEVKLVVLDGWKQASSESLTLVLPGGVVGKVGQRVEGTPRLSPGEELVVFLEARGDRFVLTGFSQGVFDVTRSWLSATATQRVPEALYLDPRTGQPMTKQPLALGLDELRGRVLQRVAAQGADSNRALPFALPTQMSR
jgi:hypothetical protein